eukprot:SAG22_NODE_82_length_21749_cov_10.719769_5_plen_604_part_00
MKRAMQAELLSVALLCMQVHAANAQDPATALCNHIAARGSCGTMADLCPAACVRNASGGVAPRGSGAGHTQHSAGEAPSWKTWMRRAQQVADADSSPLCGRLESAGMLDCSAFDDVTLCPAACAMATLSTQNASSAGGGGDPSHCAELAARGASCSLIADLCPATACSDDASNTAAGGAPEPAAPAVPADQVSCSAVASNGACNPAMSSLCPAACEAAPPAAGAGGGRPTLSGEGGVYAASCAVLIELDGGCAHDLSSEDPAAGDGRRVSDVCPEECSGHSGCALTAADVAFLEVARDSSGHSVQVELGGDACVDGGGVLLSGQGWVELAVGSDYISDGAGTVSFWLLKGAAPVWSPQDDGAPRVREVVFSHPAAEYGGDHVEISLAREAWLDHYTLQVKLGAAGGTPIWSFAVDAHHGEVPMWTHLSIVVDGSSARLYRDGIDTAGEQHTAVPYSWYMGCFADNQDGVRDLTGANYGTPGPTASERVFQCMELCDGYQYFGMQWVNECYCGDSYNDGNNANSPDCPGGECPATDCDSDGAVGAYPDFADRCGVGQNDCGNHNAVYRIGGRAGEQHNYSHLAGRSALFRRVVLFGAYIFVHFS